MSTTGKDDAGDALAAPAQPSPPTPSRTASRSIPPPIPQRPLQLLVVGRPESPSVIDRAIAAGEPRDRAELLAPTVEAAIAANTPDAASLAYELGELYEQQRDETNAIAAYRRALDVDRSLQPPAWAL